MTPKEVYECYLALKRHFTSDYDYHKYKGRVKVKEDTFTKRKDKYSFVWLSRHDDPFNFILSNLVNNEKFYIKQVRIRECTEIYNQWVERNKDLISNFKKDLEKIPCISSSFDMYEGKHPDIIKKLIVSDISIETFIILLDMTQTRVKNR